MPVPAWFTELLQKELRLWLTLSKDQVRILWDHYETLLRWNQKISLTSIPAGEEMVVRHYCESLFFVAHMPIKSEAAFLVLDVGSGAGFPGIPMAVLRPAWKITLLESNQRKAVFLRESTRGLSNIAVLARRAESISGGFDWLVSRGVDPADVMKNVPRVAPSVGLMLGQDDFSTIKSLSDVAWLESVQLPWGDRRVCVYGKFHVENDLDVSRGTT